jgi:elongation factor Tu
VSFFDGYRPQFWFRTVDVDGTVTLPTKGVERIKSGDTGEMEVSLRDPLAMEVGMRFAVRDAGRVIGDGVVTKVLR